MASQESAQDIAQSLLRPSISQIALDKFRASPFFSGIDGRGSSIVILDTGIDLNHPFFGADKDKNGISDRIVFSYDFSGNNDPDASDTSGHGSNVSSIAAGIAPGVNIIHLKVFKDKTPFEEGGADPRDIDEALKWVINNARRYNIVSVNMSVEDGLAYTRAIPDSFSGKQLASLASQGIAVITAAGNAFYELNSKLGVTAYSADPNTISVGAVWNDDYGYSSWPNGTRKFPIDRTTGRDRIVSFSQRHPTLLDIFAPGAIVEGADTKGGTNQESGTSQAAPHITGLVALAQQLAVRELGRLLKVEEFRTLLKVTGDIIKDGDDEDDNVVNTGLNFRRVNAFGMGEAILTRKLGRFPTTRNDNIKGRQTNDYIAGFDGNDLLKGEDGQDILQGGFGSDSLFGGAGRDYLNGGRGNDWLSGDGGTDFLTGGGGRDRFVIRQRDGIDVVADFGGVGRGSSVSAATLAETDTLKFEGSGFTASQLLLTQVGNHTLVSFEGVSDTGVWLKNVRLETLDNLGRAIASNPANILFNKQKTPQDSFDVFDADSTQHQIWNRNTVTFLNDLNNQVRGFDNSNDVINGQRGNDTLLGLSGDDLLRGGDGDDILAGGTGTNRLVGGAGVDTFIISKNALTYISDFTPGYDLIRLADGLTADQLKIEQGIGNRANEIWLKLDSRDVPLASLTGDGSTLRALT